jgi:hypothetical protein
MKEENGTATLQPYTVKQLASMFGVDPKTFRGWITDRIDPVEIGIKSGHYFTIRQVKIIFDNFGSPPKYGNKSAAA